MTTDPLPTLCDGVTPNGRRVRAVQTSDHPHDVEITVDGEPAELIARPRLYRDGGTRVFETDKGTLVFPRRINSSDRTPRLDGEPIT